ncbi:MAG: MurR/RpiR family transcriptional regulator [Ruminococcaceae bacterium]|nr:MurR/RpiR family transcriptional regulator [Oscillospiraceae bacterium]
MPEHYDLIEKIKGAMPGFSKSQKRIASYIMEHYDKAAFMTAAKLGKVTEVSESTVVRFAVELGFDGYPRFQKALQELIRNKLTSVQRMEITTSKMGEQDILRTVLLSDAEKLRSTLDEVDKEAFAGAVEAIAGAKRIYILGARSCYALASFLSFYLNLIFPNVKMVSNSAATETFEQMFRAGEGDVVIGISFPRYSRRTVNALAYAAGQGAKVIAITDSARSPITGNAAHTLVARSDMSSFVDSLVAPLSIINALIVALVMRNKDEVAETFGRLEHIWEEYQVYDQRTEGNDE